LVEVSSVLVRPVAWGCLFSLNLKQDLAVGILLVLYIHCLYLWLAHFSDMLGGDRGITRTYRNHDASRSTH